jgi:polo-like kinase 1
LYFFRTLCGTPNYSKSSLFFVIVYSILCFLVAPEVINKKGHSYEVDVWSLGCILYTLLLGKPPFETSSLKDTYTKIRKNDYLIPDNRISRESVLLIQRCLKHEPYERPTMSQIYLDVFFAGFTPATLPTSVCTVAPRYSVMPPPNPMQQQPTMINANKPTTTPIQQQQRRPFTEQQQNEQILIASRHQQVVTLPTPILMNDRTNDIHGLGPRAASAMPNQTDMVLSSQMARQLTGLDGQAFVPPGATNEEINDDLHLAIDLQRQLEHLIQLKPNEKPDKHEDEAEDPASAPMLWISKWVDYSDKYGLGYQLCDDSVGVLFNDSTRLIMTAGGAENLQYIDREGYEHLCTMKDYSDQLKKKVTLLKVIVRKLFRILLFSHL